MCHRRMNGCPHEYCFGCTLKFEALFLYQDNILAKETSAQLSRINLVCLDNL